MIECMPVWAGLSKHDKIPAGVVWDATIPHLDMVLCEAELADTSLQNADELEGKLAAAEWLVVFPDKADRAIGSGARAVGSSHNDGAA